MRSGAWVLPLRPRPRPFSSGQVEPVGAGLQAEADGVEAIASDLAGENPNQDA